MIDQSFANRCVFRVIGHWGGCTQGVYVNGEHLGHGALIWPNGSIHCQTCGMHAVMESGGLGYGDLTLIYKEVKA